MITILKNIINNKQKPHKIKRGNIVLKSICIMQLIKSFCNEKITNIFTKYYKVYNTVIVKNMKKIVHYFKTKMEGPPIVNCLLPIINSLGLGTNLLPCCYTQINKNNNTNVNKLNAKTISIRKYYKEITKIAAIITILFIAAKLTNI